MEILEVLEETNVLLGSLIDMTTKLPLFLSACTGETTSWITSSPPYELCLYISDNEKQTLTANNMK